MRRPTPDSVEPSAARDGTVSVRRDAADARDVRGEEVIPIAEEEVQIGKRQVTTGRVRVRTLVDVVQEPVRASLEEEVVEVVRVPVGREISEAPQVRTENGVTIVPVIEEVLVVEKRLVLKEELHIRRNTRTENVEIPVELRKQRAEIERLPAVEPSSDSE